MTPQDGWMDYRDVKLYDSKKKKKNKKKKSVCSKIMWDLSVEPSIEQLFRARAKRRAVRSELYRLKITEPLP